MYSKVSKIAFIFSAAVICYVAFLYQYNLPSADDFGYIQSRISGITPLEFTINHYYVWNGRLVANFFYSLFLPSVNPALYQILTFTIFLTFLFLVNCIIYSLNKYKLYSLMLSAIYLATLIASMNDISSTIFWMGGVVNYFIAIIFFLVTILGLIKKNVFMTILSIIAVFLASLCSEAFSVTIFVFYSAALLCFVCTKDRFRVKLTSIYLLIIFTCILIMYFCPGNSIRAAHEEFLSLPNVLIKSFLLALERCSEWLFISPLIPATILIATIIRSSKLPKLIESLSYKVHGICMIIFGVILAWMPHFTMAYAMGYPSLPNRAKFIAQFFFQSLFIIGLIYLLKHYKLDERLSKSSKGMLIALFAFILMFLTTKDIFPSLRYLGKLKGYYNEQIIRFETAKNSDEDVITIEPYPYSPTITGKASFQKGNNEGIAKIYGKEAIVLEKDDGYENYPTIWTATKKYWKKP